MRIVVGLGFLSDRGKPMIDAKNLTIRHYLNSPIMWLIDHPDFDSEIFWKVAAMTDIPAKELLEQFELTKGPRE